MDDKLTSPLSFNLPNNYERGGLASEKVLHLAYMDWLAVSFLPLQIMTDIVFA